MASPEDLEAELPDEDVEFEPAEDIPLEEIGPRDLPAAPPTPLDVRDIALDDIYELPNIRPDYHGISHLADSLHVQGQQEPVLVRPAPADAPHGKPFELIFGNRRKRAAEELGWENVRAEVRTVPDERRRQVAIIENFHREGLSSVAEARAMYDLKFSADPPLTNREVANQLGIDPSQVSHRLNMLIKLAPARPAPELPAVAAGDNDSDDDTDDAMDSGDDAVVQATASTEQPLRDEHGALVLPGDPLPRSENEGEEGADGDEDGADDKPKGIDILALVDQGRISGSVAEVIASLDDRESQEKLAQLCIRQDWGVKKASEWARAAKKNDIEAVTDAEEGLGPVEMLDMVDVTPLQVLRLREDITDQEIARVTVYALLRNGMDQEILQFLYERMGYTYETLWDYLALLDDDQVQELQQRLAVRYVTSAHRFFDLEPSLKDQLGVPEEAFAEPEALALPGYTPPESAGALPADSEA